MQDGWTVLASELGINEDDFLRPVREYWASLGYLIAPANSLPTSLIPVLNRPQTGFDGKIMTAAAFRFAMDQEFRCAQLTQPPGMRLASAVALLPTGNPWSSRSQFE